jgi:hypothetical protein
MFYCIGRSNQESNDLLLSVGCLLFAWFWLDARSPTSLVGQGPGCPVRGLIAWGGGAGRASLSVAIRAEMSDNEKAGTIDAPFFVARFSCFSPTHTQRCPMSNAIIETKDC